MKCKGEIVSPAGVVGLSEHKTRMSLPDLFEKIWKAMLVNSNDHRLRVNFCIKCGDLEVGDEWQESSILLKSAVKEGAISVNGKIKICDHCAHCISANSRVYGMKE